MLFVVLFQALEQQNPVNSNTIFYSQHSGKNQSFIGLKRQKFDTQDYLKQQNQAL